MSAIPHNTKRSLAISTAAHKHLTQYAELLAKQLGLSNVTLYDAANRLIISTPLPYNNSHDEVKEEK